MAKASKYEALVGSVVNGVLVVSYKREPRTSKTGRNYTVGRLNVCYVSNKEAVLNISISSYNKWSFIKNLDKLNGVNSSSSKKQQKTTTGKTKQQTKTTSSKQQQTKTTSKTKQQHGELFNILKTTYDLRELKNAYRKLSKIYHPDMATGNAEMFKLANNIYKVRKEAITRATSSFDPSTDKEAWFKEDVDLMEQSIKDNENIKY